MYGNIEYLKLNVATMLIKCMNIRFYLHYLQRYFVHKIHDLGLKTITAQKIGSCIRN